jgi:hypothetical protein
MYALMSQLASESVSLVMLIKGSTTPACAGHVIAAAVLNDRAETGAYYDEPGKPMRDSSLVHDPVFQDRVVAETRAFLAAAT